MKPSSEQKVQHKKDGSQLTSVTRGGTFKVLESTKHTFLVSGLREMILAKHLSFPGNIIRTADSFISLLLIFHYVSFSVKKHLNKNFFPLYQENLQERENFKAQQPCQCLIKQHLSKRYGASISLSVCRTTIVGHTRDTNPKDYSYHR